MQYCTNVVRDCYKGNNPYEGYPDGDVLKQHLQRISALVLSPDFPKGKKQLEMATNHLQKLCYINEEEYKEQSAALKPDLLRLFKQLAASNKAQELASLIEPLLNLHNTVQEAANDEKEKAMGELAFKSFGEWTTQYLELLENFKQSGIEDEYAPTLITETREDFKPKESDVQHWFKITKAMWAIPTYKMQKGVRRILDNNNLKLMWNWKQNIHEAIEMIDIVDKLNLPTEGDEWDDRSIVEQCGSAVYNLIKMLQVLKIDHMIMTEVGRMTINKMKLRSLLSYKMIGEYSGEIDFEKCSEVCPELMKKLEELILDPGYPWHEFRFTSNAITIFRAIWYALRSKEDIPTEYSQSMIKVFLFCMDDDCNLLSPLDGSYTLHGQLLTGYMSYFIQKHCSAGLGDECSPLLKVCLKYRHKEEDKLKEMTIAAFESASQYCPNICSKFLQPLLDWYIEEHLGSLVGVFANIVEDPGSHDRFSNVMDKFMDACKDQSDTYYRQLVMFAKIAAEKPNMFTMKAVDIIMKYHYKDKALKTQVLYGIMDNITKKNPQVFAHHMNTLMADKSIPVMEQNYINTVLLNVTKSIQKFKEPVFKYLMKSLKETNDITAIHVNLNSLRQFAGVHGLDLLRSQKEYFRKRREKEKDVDVKGGFTVIIDQIEGRSLEKVDQNIKETQEGVDKLDQRVTGTEKVVGDLTTRVDEHDENIQELGEGLDTVTQRVDFAEKDIEETKIKVQEIDMKTMTNAPRWSRDLTKIMNPQTEHDWRLLAQRLGYSNDDIRAWASQHDPCMAVLSEWYATHKTREANYAVLTALQEISRMDGAAIVENAMKAVVDVVEEEEVDYSSPPPVFLSYQWGHQDEVKLIRNHLQMAGYECWMDIGQMGGGDKLFEKIDSGIRGAKVIICCVSEKYAQSPNCNREVNLSVSLGKPMIPLLMEKMGWPPKGSMGPIFSEYLFVRFFQRVGEETDDQRIWPVAKFKEMLMQLNCYGILPEESLIDTMYKNWWIPVQEVIVIDKTKKKRTQSEAKQKESKNEVWLKRNTFED
ncbi:uncharacterized protein LOC127733711 [Mytilus californianus]|uniref:uncharacterized protein LOC127733711 n=1 Tax=Mytilus californianus TaxID=6549 RepID=UPI002246DF9C|nr:uncharacterized protein LOC127733711 [Mytilus californianus]